MRVSYSKKEESKQQGLRTAGVNHENAQNLARQAYRKKIELTRLVRMIDAPDMRGRPRRIVNRLVMLNQILSLSQQIQLIEVHLSPLATK